VGSSGAEALSRGTVYRSAGSAAPPEGSYAAMNRRSSTVCTRLCNRDTIRIKIKTRIKDKIKGNGQECPFHTGKGNLNIHRAVV
jgi:hypothetical protein